MRLFATFLVICGLFPGLVASAEVCDHPFFRPYYKTRSHFCTPGQIVIDFYTNERIRCEDAEVDHVVSLLEAYLGGVCGSDLKRLANDPDNLRLTHWTRNRRKAALPVEAFLEIEDVRRGAEARALAGQIRGKYRILGHEEIMTLRVSRHLSNSAGAKRIISLAAARGITGVVERTIDNKKFFFVGKRVVGYAVGVGAAAEVVLLAPRGFELLARSLSTDDQIRRADYIQGLLD